MGSFFKLSSLSVALVALVLATGCHSKKTGDGSNADAPVFVEDFSGTPMNFSGLYTSTRDQGFCRLETDGRVFDNCQIKIKIEQTVSNGKPNRRFRVTSTFEILNPRSNRNARITNRVVETLRITENVLTSSTGDVGVIGSSGFRYQTSQSQLSMVKDGFKKFKLVGYYHTDSGSRVTITGRVGLPGSDRDRDQR